MPLRHPELIKSARQLAILQWLALLALPLLVVSLILPLASGFLGDSASATQIAPISLAGTLASLVIVIPAILTIRNRRQHLVKVDRLLHAGATRALEMRRRFGFTGLIALRLPGETAMPANAHGKASRPEPAWWLQPLVTKGRLPGLGNRQAKCEWHPPSTGQLLAWHAPKLGWGQVLHADEIRRQGRTIVLVLLAFGFSIPLLIGIMLALLLNSMVPMTEFSADESRQLEPTSAQAMASAPAQATAADKAPATSLTETADQASRQLDKQIRLLWLTLAALPLLTSVLAWLTWRETHQIAASARDPNQL